MISDMQVPVQMYTDALTQPIIAPVQETLTAKQAYGSGAYFIYRSKLYKTTAAIAQGGSIVLEGSGANATPAGTVMERVGVGYEKIGDYTPDATYFSSGTVTLYANKETRHCILYLDNLITKATSASSFILCTLSTGYSPLKTVAVLAGLFDPNNFVITPVLVTNPNYNNNVNILKNSGFTAGLNLYAVLEWNY